MSDRDRQASAWDTEYQHGRYDQEPPVAFVDDILDVARSQGMIGRPGLYIGCGNGRNYVPLVKGGLDLVGIDISGVAIDQLSQRLPERRSKLVTGDLSALPQESVFPLVIGLQVFQHGNRAQTHEHIKAAQDRVAADGIFCLRVNAVGTDVEHDHKQTEVDSDGGMTIQYLDGPKAGLDVHFFSEAELARLFEAWEPLRPLKPQVTQRDPVERGQWTQWEAIWRRAGSREQLP